MPRMMRANLFQYGNNQSGKKMSLEENPKKVLKSSLEILQKSYKVAKKKDDLENMLAISDRLMVLYELLNNIKEDRKTTKLGFLGDHDE